MPNMRVPGTFFVNQALEKLMFEVRLVSRVCVYRRRSGVSGRTRRRGDDEVNDRWCWCGRRPQELEMYTKRGDTGGFLPAMKQLANVAGLPGASP